MVVSIGGNDQTLPETLKRVLHPPRIIRALINHKIQKRTGDFESLIVDALEIGLRTYCGEDTSPLISRLKLDIIERDAALLEEYVLQLKDAVTWEASNPQYSNLTSQRIAKITQNDVLLIALAHGGVAAGMDVFLRYCDQVESSRSSFYAVRLSQTKHDDKRPKLNRSERLMLQEWALGKDVIVLDEDSHTGDTLRSAKKYFQKLFPKQEVRVVANIMTREAKGKLYGSLI